MKIEKIVLWILLSGTMLSLTACGGVTHNTQTEFKRTESYTNTKISKTLQLDISIDKTKTLSSKDGLGIGLRRKVRYDVYNKDIMIEKTVSERNPNALMSVVGVALLPVAVIFGDTDEHLNAIEKDMFGEKEVLSTTEKETNIRKTGENKDLWINTIDSGTLNIYIDNALAKTCLVENTGYVTVSFDDLFGQLESAHSPFNIAASFSSGGLEQKIALEKRISIAGAEYEGPLTYGKPHGNGKLTWPDGKVYAGFFESGKKTSQNETGADREQTNDVEQKTHTETMRFEISSGALTTGGKKYYNTPTADANGVKLAEVESWEKITGEASIPGVPAGIRLYHYRVANPNQYDVLVTFCIAKGTQFVYQMLEVKGGIKVYQANTFQPGNDEMAKIYPLTTGSYNWHPAGTDMSNRYVKDEQPEQFIMPKNSSFEIRLFLQDGLPSDKERLPNGTIKYPFEDYRLYYNPAIGSMETKPYGVKAEATVRESQPKEKLKEFSYENHVFKATTKIPEKYFGHYDSKHMSHASLRNYSLDLYRDGTCTYNGEDCEWGAMVDDNGKLNLEETHPRNSKFESYMGIGLFIKSRSTGEVILRTMGHLKSEALGQSYLKVGSFLKKEY
ncbi:hypothetical protein [Desulfosarcina ovata]|uniref:Lipoprotein n=2 Tax=Desulfosarcina ovata TaxID=83564 RepID=A0A5K8AEP3_9BACT|nr:hypothetical protein [Desulfosarcina ovata]BBO84536.1 hypothetical protein DSCO28_51020 [Desulfosarcina ovata subsp. sediminis]BBO91009.1 hypothetical protein DSCOOX_41890 [Desulfosarcina ovata subsp. ovata]